MNTRFGFKLTDWQETRKEMRNILIGVAKKKKTIAYSELCNQVSKIKLEPDSPALASMLGEISTDEFNKNSPLLSVLVVHKNGDLMPGQGFFELAESLEMNVGDKEAFWIDQLKLVYEYKWK